MEDQGKRLLLAVAIAFAIMAGWSLMFPQENPEDTKKETPTEATAPAPGAPSGATAEPAAGTPAAGAAVPSAPRGAEQEVVLAFDQFRATFSTYGGALKSWELLGAQFYDGDKSTPEDLVRAEDEALWPFQISFPGSTHVIAPGAEWTVSNQTATEVAFRHRAGPLEVTKTYTIHPADYLVALTIEAKIDGGGPARQNLVVSIGSAQNPSEIVDGGMTQVGREWKAACYANEELATWSVKELTASGKEVGGRVDWFGFIYPYFLTAVAVEPRDERVTCRVTGVGAEKGPMLVEAVFAPVDLQAGTAYRRTVAGYLGPKYMGKLEAVATILGWQATGFEESIDLGWLWFLAGPLLWLLNFFYGLVANWPLAIVLLTVTVKLATLYWTHKSMKSMKAMARLKPELEAVKEKYKDDRQRQQVETMNLFKAHGVNPLAGCLPMLLQMPIWFALYKALSVAAELYQAEFLWIDDLTAADPYFILPVFMTLMMLVQSLMTPTTATGAQQKMLSYGMPIIFGAMSLFFPAGLTLYISTNSILTLLHHLYMRAEDKRAPAATVVAPVEESAIVKAASRVRGGAGKAPAVIDVEDADAGDGGDAPPPRKGGSNGAGGGRRRSRGRGGRRRGAQS